MNIQDRKKTLTVEELRRRYNLDALDKDRKAIQLVKNTINKTEIEFQKYILAINNSLEEYPNQADGNITAWFFNGIPTEEQLIFENKEEHLGDLYYNRESGLSYQYKIVNDEYIWEAINNYQIKESLAIASAAPDTVDNKRITFLTSPQTPYNIGDIWINNGTYYRCRSSRDAGTYNIADWLKSAEYTDDLVALQTKVELDQFKTQVAENYVSNATLETTTNSITEKVEETYTYVTSVETENNKTNINLNNNYYNKEQIDVMNTSTQETVVQIKNTVEATTTATNLQISILQEQLNNGITSVRTETGYTFDKDGLKIQKSDSEMSSLLDNDGLVVKRNDTEVLTVRSSGVETENLTVRTYFTIGDNTRVENYKSGTGFFYIGGAN